MDKNIILLLILFLWNVVPVFAQADYNVLDWNGSISWHTHLINQMHEQYNDRDDRVDQAMAYPAEINKYQAELQDRYDRILGSFPDKTPLNAKVTGSIPGSNYHIEKLFYESFPNHHVTANLYIPEGEGPFASILLFCGHEDEAKAAKTYQRMAISLAQNGFIALVIDPISQSERLQLTDAQGQSLARGGTTEHTLLNVGSDLVGTNVMNYEYWDNKRGLDYLLTRSEVDTSKIGVMGNSGGGTMSTYFMSLNNKVKAAAVASWVTRRERAIEVLGPQDGCQWIPYEGRERLEISDFMILNNMIPTLILAGKYDFVDYVGTKEAFQEMKHLYQTIDQPEEVKLFSYADGHGISKPKRIATVEWFNRWFYGDSSRVEEEELQLHSEEQLQVTKTGQVTTAFEKEYTIQQRNIDLANALKSQRAEFQEAVDREEFRKKVKSLLGFHENTSAVEAEFSGTIDQGNYKWHKVILRKKGEVPLPLLISGLQEKEKASGIEIWLSEEGKASIFKKERNQLQKSLNSGKTVIAVDLRGTGELEDPEEFNNPKYYDNQYRNNQISLHIGKPVVGQRVQDILTILDFISKDSRLGSERIDVYAHGYVALPALHLAALDDRVDQFSFSKTIRSYMELLKNPTMKNGYAYVVPDVLKYYDLPHLVEFAGSERIIYKSDAGEGNISLK
jgi:dienelactone hydrolase